MSQIQVPSEQKATTAFIPCQVFEGFFPNELSVRIDLGEESLVAFVRVDSVVVTKGRIGPEEVAEGDLRVTVLRQVGDELIVALPADTLSTGSRLAVRKELVHSI